ncbi:glucose-6-phosphate dehydrogenase assembly protein OpcA [Mycolicibacterium brumae]|uniref:Glucose-6-phosphate dehydrogenase assembly protein OpcA n=1 Tax=Mycolicibacterium brumae TaxID=85968 RepID=A0A2G5PA33_9MYCO|nr:glucose-6-phosphate dehydrogenase assembly protein OpcA [Mycolicibacterium brumae]MCV7193657.1 glucose-6-phosphate dehydrogenase assembly protein OpcA [Mycolicibacterium brumae]PIB75117.1 glucose-6-phosphate dehydrogenase assembly protein OpcA [Mycolicibacterium brumae]UWW09070.1 glucose-6-phosphate dehydrogenase assembly protein OpcA [Mycolicibacterium brumae]
MIIDLPDTTTNAVNARLLAISEELGASAMGRVLTLVIAPDTDATIEDSIAAACYASHEHPCRVILVSPADRLADTPRLDAQIRTGADAGAGEVVVLRLSGALARQSASVVVPFLLPDTPVVAWWPDVAPSVPADHPLGKLAVRRITDATRAVDPLAAIRSRLVGHRAGDTDLCWARATYWRALLAAAVDQAPGQQIRSVLVAGRKGEPALDIMAGWLAARLSVPVRRAVSDDPRVELNTGAETVTLSRPQDGLTATLSRTGRPDALLPLAYRGTPDCLAEELRRLSADEIYAEALRGLDQVEYV